MRGETKLTLSLVCVYRPADGWLLFAPAQRTPVSIIDILWHWTQSEQLLQTVTHLPLGDSRCSLLTADCGLYQSVLVCSLEQDNINYNTILDMMLPPLYQSEGFRFDILPNRNPQSGQCWDSIVITHSLLSLGTQCHRGISNREKQDTDHFDTFNQSWPKLKRSKWEMWPSEGDYGNQPGVKL